MEFDGIRYSYDEEGNLIEKIEADGTHWRYDYYGNGMMSKVVRPDGREVTFTYDPLGRRIEKEYDGIKTTYVWDGNTILHEWKDEPQTATTWVFDDGTFQPAAKLTPEGRFSIVNDHLGTPVEMYDEQGERVWAAELDIYGNVQWTGLKGNRLDCPFRYQGQYEDEETGLYYNRFRYYSPYEGMYTQQDPLGLKGGIVLYGYVSDPNAWVDPFGLFGLIRYRPHVSLSAKPGARETAIHRAWALEKKLILATDRGTRNWSAEEIELIKSTPNSRLLSEMSAQGYTGHHINSVEGNGSLGRKWKGDPRNIVFLSNHRTDNEHVYSDQGHRGSTQNATRGRLIDRQAMLDQAEKGRNPIKCKR